MSDPSTARPTTSGTDTRQPRQLHPSIEVFSLDGERERLRAEPSWSEHGRAAKTLVKAPTQRLVLLLVRDGSEIGDDEAHGPLTVQVLSGSVTVAGGRQAEEARVDQGGLAWFAAGPDWRARAHGDAELLVSITWPEDRGMADGSV